jgi:enoyl-CoA hydratase
MTINPDSPRRTMPSHGGSAELVITAFADGVGRLTLNNPTRKNAITSAMAARISDFCAQVDAADDIGAVIIDAAGDYFCSGADTRDLAAASASPTSPEAQAIVSAVYDAFVAFGCLTVPTVAVVVGGAVGAGLNLALAADVVLTTPTARFDSGFVQRQIHPGGGHFSLLGRHLNRQQAMAVAVFGQSLTGTDVVRLGAAWETFEPSHIEQEALKLVAGAAADPALARKVKRSAALQLGPPAVSWGAAVELERGAQMWSMARKGSRDWGPPERRSPHRPGR